MRVIENVSPKEHKVICEMNKKTSIIAMEVILLLNSRCAQIFAI